MGHRAISGLLLAALLAAAPVVAGAGAAEAAAPDAARVAPPGGVADPDAVRTGPSGSFVDATLPGLGGGGVQVHSDGTTTVPTSTDPVRPTGWTADSVLGRLFGASRGHVPLRVGVAGHGGPTTLTVVPDQAPPGWTLVLGSVGEGSFAVSAVGEDDDLPVRSLGLGPVVDETATGASALPAWDPTTGTLTSSTGAPPAAGATTWLRPRADVRAVRITFTPASPEDTFDAWLAAPVLPVTGRMTTLSGRCDPTTAVLALTDGTGPSARVLASTSPGPRGSFGFARVSPRAGLAVQLGRPPRGCASARDVSALGFTASGATVGFGVRQLLGTIAVEVTDRGGSKAVRGVTVALTGPRGYAARGTSGAEGRIRFAGLVPGAYSMRLLPLPGYAVVGQGTFPVAVPEGGLTVRRQLLLRIDGPPGTPVAPQVPGAIATTTTGAAAAPQVAGAVTTTTTATSTTTSAGLSTGTTSSTSGTATTSGPTGTRSGLPDTGGPAGALPWLGGGLLLVGAGVVRGARGPWRPAVTAGRRRA